MFKFPATNLDWIEKSTIFLTKHGSQAYGTSTPTSDTDYKGLCIPPSKYFKGYLNHFEQAEWRHDPDMVVYDIRKFFKLAADCNPSIIEVLFTDESDHIICNDLGKVLLANKNSFISKKAKHTFSGYAISQLKRIEGHYRWLKNPPKEKPTRESLGLPPKTVIPKDQLGAAQSLIKKKLESWVMPTDLFGFDDAANIQFIDQLEAILTEISGSTDLSWQAGRSLGFTDDFLHLLDQERLYKNKSDEWVSYQKWLSDRNPARAEIEAKYGYDTKHGMHLVRLLRMGREILEGKGVIVKRPDAQELLEIRNGAWEYEKLVEYAKNEQKVMDELYKTSKAIPMEPDRNLLDDLCQILVESHLTVKFF